MRELEKNELNSLFHNYLVAELLENGAVRFHRFSEQQKKQYYYDSLKTGKDYVLRTMASSNIILDCITNSEVLGIQYLWNPATGHDEAVFDFYVDGVLYGYHETTEKDEGILAFDIPQGEHRITLFFPWQVIVDIKSIILSEGAYVKKIRRNRRILVFGDSISQGYICRHPSLSYTGYITRKLDAECLNQAIGGYWFEKNSLDEKLQFWEPDCIITAYGTNDYFLYDTREEFSSGIREYMQKLCDIFPQTPILGIMPIPRFDEPYLAKQKIADFSLKDSYDIIRETYDKYPTVSILEDCFFPRHPDFFASDLIHPNDLGFQIYGEAVSSKIQEVLTNYP